MGCQGWQVKDVYYRAAFKDDDPRVAGQGSADPRQVNRGDGLYLNPSFGLNMAGDSLPEQGMDVKQDNWVFVRHVGPLALQNDWIRR